MLLSTATELPCSHPTFITTSALSVHPMLYSTLSNVYDFAAKHGSCTKHAGTPCNGPCYAHVTAYLLRMLQAYYCKQPMHPYCSICSMHLDGHFGFVMLVHSFSSLNAVPYSLMSQLHHCFICPIGRCQVRCAIHCFVLSTSTCSSVMIRTPHCVGISWWNVELSSSHQPSLSRTLRLRCSVYDL